MCAHVFPLGRGLDGLSRIGLSAGIGCYSAKAGGRQRQTGESVVVFVAAVVAAAAAAAAASAACSPSGGSSGRPNHWQLRRCHAEGVRRAKLASCRSFGKTFFEVAVWRHNCTLTS